MACTIKIGNGLRAVRSQFELEATTVRDVLKQIQKADPVLVAQLLGPDGNLSSRISLIVDSAMTRDLDLQLLPKNQILIEFEIRIAGG